MSTDGRLGNLERSLSPARAVRRWLAELQRFDTAQAYAASLRRDPAGVGPLIEIPRAVQAAVRATAKGQDPAVIGRTIREANRDAVFLIELVLELNSAALAIDESGTLRWVALATELRALDAEARLSATERRRSGAAPASFESWSEQARALALDILTAAAARRLLESEFLGSQRALFANVSAAAVLLRQNATSILHEAALVRALLSLDRLSAEPGPSRSFLAVELGGLRWTAAARAPTAAAAIIHEARLATVRHIRELPPAVPSVEPRPSKARSRRD